MRIIVSGPPASGKTTLAQHLAAIHSAEVVDLDVIAAELGSTDDHDHPEPVRTAALAEVERRIDTLTGDAVVIRSAPTVAERRALAERIDADHIIVLDVPADEAKRRAATDHRPDWTAGAIDRWWSRYEPDPDDQILGPTSPPTAGVTAGSAHGQRPRPETRPRSASNDRSTEESGEPMSDTGPASGSDAPADGGAGTDTDGGGTETGGGDDRRFSQAEVNDIVKQRLAKDRAKLGDVNELRRKAGEFDKLEQAKKTEVEQLTDKASQAEDRATKAELAVMRLDVAFEAAPDGMPVSKIRALAKRLSGATQEELEADAQELFAEFADAKPTGEGDDQQGKPSGAGQQRPRESMGSVPLPGGDRIQLDEETDPRKLAERIRI